MTKLAGEHLAARLRARASGSTRRAPLLQRVYGPRQRPDMAFPRVVDALARGTRSSSTATAPEPRLDLRRRRRRGDDRGDGARAGGGGLQRRRRRRGLDARVDRGLSRRSPAAASTCEPAHPSPATSGGRRPTRPGSSPSSAGGRDLVRGRRLAPSGSGRRPFATLLGSQADDGAARPARPRSRRRARGRSPLRLGPDRSAVVPAARRPARRRDPRRPCLVSSAGRSGAPRRSSTSASRSPRPAACAIPNSTRPTRASVGEVVRASGRCGRRRRRAASPSPSSAAAIATQAIVATGQARGTTTLYEIAVQGSAPRKVERAADSLAKRVSGRGRLRRGEARHASTTRSAPTSRSSTRSTGASTSPRSARNEVLNDKSLGLTERLLFVTSLNAT